MRGYQIKDFFILDLRRVASVPAPRRFLFAPRPSMAVAQQRGGTFEFGPWDGGEKDVSLSEMLDRTLRRKYHDEPNDLHAIASLEGVLQKKLKCKEASDLYEVNRVILRQACWEADPEGGAGWYLAICKAMGPKGHPYVPPMPEDLPSPTQSKQSAVATSVPAPRFGEQGAGGASNSKNFADALRFHPNATKSTMERPARALAYAKHVKCQLLAAGRKGELSDVQPVAKMFAAALIDAFGNSPVRCHSPHVRCHMCALPHVCSFASVPSHPPSHALYACARRTHAAKMQ